MTGQKIPRRPLAFGMWQWSPLPGTCCDIIWLGKGQPLEFGTGRSYRPVQHPSANGLYDTVAAADAAVQAFYAAYLAAEAAEAGGQS